MEEIQQHPYFEEFDKISRLNREIIVTEKIDGTNAAVVVTPEGLVYAQSRTRLITPKDDNFGFATWVEANTDALKEQLGEGRHFGEWWGAGIQRKYGIGEKRFSLFAIHRWHGSPEDNWRCMEAPICFVVPTILTAEQLATAYVEEALDRLRNNGSVAAPGFMDAEGIVIFHKHSRSLFKVTLKDDEKGKSYGA